MDISPATPLDELMAEARRSATPPRDRITFSPKVFIPLTMLCRDRCGYCTFAKPPARLDAPYLALDEVLADRPAGRGGRLLTRRCSRSARRPRSATRWPATWLAGARLRLDGRLPRRRCCRLVLERDGPAAPRQRRRAARGRAGRAAPGRRPSQGMMLESLPPGSASPAARTPARPTRRPSAGWPRWRRPGELAIPFTTGILVGIGETRAERIEALAGHRGRRTAATGTCRR